MPIVKTYSGYCPELKKQNFLSVEYKPINLCGDPKTYYKCVSYTCEHQAFNGCQTADTECGCPIFAEVPRSF
ncbi:hypothetical protein [Clostridium sp. JN-9]|uniref:hypothetical protein n=1 Tax=Clostridium sp. JN-9 TaxID=2507159 RepID=UPI000FFE2C06|nr:hypothetical protein [Clostridium sp. JN-9]QAT40871.1 hypothetical protein EQM05_11680 [Clostridium sp. JN-9]